MQGLSSCPLASAKVAHVGRKLARLSRRHQTVKLIAREDMELLFKPDNLTPQPAKRDKARLSKAAKGKKRNTGRWDHRVELKVQCSKGPCPTLSCHRLAVCSLGLPDHEACSRSTLSRRREACQNSDHQLGSSSSSQREAPSRDEPDEKRILVLYLYHHPLYRIHYRTLLLSSMPYIVYGL